MSSSEYIEYDHSVFSAQKPHFFRIILEDSIRDGKLVIPAKFVRKYLSYVSLSVMLEVPSGKKWEVELSKSDGKIWLQNGWKEFAEHNSLKHGYLVVFKYEGDSKFHVLVFDMSCTEIEYPKFSTEDDDLSFEILDQLPSFCRKRECSSSPCTRPCKIRKTNSTKETEISSNSKLATSGRKRGGGISGQKCQQTEVVKGVRKLKTKEKSKALQKAASFKSKNPYFLAVMQPSYVCFGYKMAIPWSFANAYLKRTHDGIILYLNGKTWPVKYFYRAEQKNAQLRGGWKTFSQDNNLEVGDVCAFEMIDSLKMSWKVVIYRKAEDATLRSSLDEFASYSQGVGRKIYRVRKHAQSNYLGRMKPLSCNEKARAFERAESFKSNNPFFMVVMQPYYITRQLYIPTPFAKKYLSRSGEVMLRVSNGRTWTVECVSWLAKGQLKAKFIHPWRAFVMDNNLQVGDVCIFELIEDKKIVLDVAIFPASDANQPSTTSVLANHGSLNEPTSRKISCQRSSSPQTSRACEDSARFVSKHPSFMKTIQPTHVDTAMGVPFEFIKKITGHKKESDVILQVEDRWWPVKLVSMLPCYTSGRFCGGWPKFARDNSLKLGDVCVFELIKASVVVMIKVSILRC